MPRPGTADVIRATTPTSETRTVTQTLSREPAVETALDHAPRRVVAAAADHARAGAHRAGHRRRRRGPASAGTTSVEDSFTAKLNDARASRGIPRLTTRSALVQVAREQARRMAGSEPALPQPHAHLGRHELALGRRERRLRPERGLRAHGLHEQPRAQGQHPGPRLHRGRHRRGRRQRPGLGRRGVPAPDAAPPRDQLAHHARDATPTSSPTAAPAPRSRGSRPAWASARPASTAPTTRAAVSRFQKSLGWRGRGNVGPTTWSRLF